MKTQTRTILTFDLCKLLLRLPGLLLLLFLLLFLFLLLLPFLIVLLLLLLFLLLLLLAVLLLLRFQNHRPKWRSSEVSKRGVRIPQREVRKLIVGIRTKSDCFSPKNLLGTPQHLNETPLMTKPKYLTKVKKPSV